MMNDRSVVQNITLLAKNAFCTDKKAIYLEMIHLCAAYIAYDTDCW